MTQANCRVSALADLTQLRHNFETIRQRIAPLDLLAVVKADAYGIGVHPVAETLKAAGCAGFGVSCWQEAEELLGCGLPIQILGGIFPGELPHVVQNGIIAGITDPETAQEYNAEAARQNRILQCHFKLDTGMGRLGIRWEQAPELIRHITATMPNLDCCGIYAHFPKVSDEPFSLEQVRRFKQVLSDCSAAGISFRKIHMANTDAQEMLEPVCSAPFNMVRTGLGLYRNVVSLRTKLVSARWMPAGHSIGYERTCILEKDTLVGTIAAGYADGLPLAISNRGRVLCQGKFCPILGRISMDYTTIALDPETAWRKGDTVTLIGREGTEQIAMEEWADLKQTHIYDILCSISPRVKREYC